MSSPGVLEARAESACRLINLTIGFHRSQSIGHARLAFASRLSAPDFDQHQVQRQATLLRMLSIAEAFCVDRILEQAEDEVEPQGSPVRALMWDRASTSAVSNWEGIRRTYKTWYNLRPEWGPVGQFVEVRNAIAHGLGQITRMQRLNLASTLSKIAGAGVLVDEERIVLDESNLNHARIVCLDLIADVDSKVGALRS